MRCALDSGLRKVIPPDEWWPAQAGSVRLPPASTNTQIGEACVSCIAFVSVCAAGSQDRARGREQVVKRLRNSGVPVRDSGSSGVLRREYFSSPSDNRSSKDGLNRLEQHLTGSYSRS